MNPTRYVRAFVTSFVLFLLLDAFWHGAFMTDFYSQRLLILNPSLAGATLSFSPFILFVNAINAVALSYFVLSHMDQGRPLSDAAWVGALLGFTVAGSVNFLNHALLVHWDIMLVLVDTAWSTVAGLIAALAIAVSCAESKPRGIFGMMKRS